MDPLVSVVVNRYNTSRLIHRVVTRFATEFSSPEALKEYLHEHPQADKSKHHVKKPGGEEHGDHKEEPKKSWKERLKGLSEAATKFMTDAPKSVKQFIEDDDFRRKTLQDAHKALTDAPEKIAKNALKTVKHEVQEFKEAGQGIAAVLKGEKMNDHQKKALKVVAKHMAISVAAAVLTSSGPLAVAGAVGKGLVKHVAMKAVSNMFGHLHVLEEIGHIGHGVKHLMEHLASDSKSPEAVLARYLQAAEKGEKPDPDEVITNFVMAAVAKEIPKIDDAAIKSALEDKEDEGGKEAALILRVAARFTGVSSSR